MLSHEWQELEDLSDRIVEMRNQYEVARRRNQFGLVQALRNDIAVAVRQRESLVHHISARFGTLAA